MTFVDWVGISAVVIPAIISGYKIFAMLKDIQKDQKILKMDTLRLQLLQMIQHDPTNRVAITGLYDQYVSAGGNSYLNAEFNKWSKKYNNSKTKK